MGNTPWRGFYGNENRFWSTLNSPSLHLFLNVCDQIMQLQKCWFFKKKSETLKMSKSLHGPKCPCLVCPWSVCWYYVCLAIFKHLNHYLKWILMLFFFTAWTSVRTSIVLGTLLWSVPTRCVSVHSLKFENTEATEEEYYEFSHSP